jgi:hypothetical protein
MKTFATKEEKKAYYAAKQKKISAKAAELEAAAKIRNTYDVAANVAGIAAEALATPVQMERNTLGGSYSADYTVADFLAADGQPNESFWSDWRNQDDAYGLNRGAMSFKAQLANQKIGVTKLTDGRWSLTINATSIL